jgi:hypothetical protein
MKKLLLLLSIVAAFALQAPAEIAVYKLKLKSTLSGSGRVVKNSLAGYFIHDVDTAEVAFIITQKVNLKNVFNVQTIDNHSINQINIGPLKSLSVVSQSDVFLDNDGNEHTDTFTMKGANVTVNIGATNLWNIPRTMTWTGRSTYPDSTPFPDAILEETTGALGIDLKTSVILNTAHDDIDQATEYLRQSLITLGYEES